MFLLRNRKIHLIILLQFSSSGALRCSLWTGHIQHSFYNVHFQETTNTLARLYSSYSSFEKLSCQLFCLYFQVFIFITVTSFGPLPCSIITTTRKFFTILASVIIFANPMNSRQWVGTVLVFTGLGLDSVYGKEKKENKGQR